MIICNLTDRIIPKSSRHIYLKITWDLLYNLLSNLLSNLLNNPLYNYKSVAEDAYINTPFL
jgi:hypothetical protein